MIFAGPGCDGESIAMAVVLRQRGATEAVTNRLSSLTIIDRVSRDVWGTGGCPNIGGLAMQLF